MPDHALKKVTKLDYKHSAEFLETLNFKTDQTTLL